MIIQDILTRANVMTVSTILLTLTLIFSLKSCDDAKKQQAQIESTVISQKELQDNITRSLSKFASKDDLEEIAKQNKINLDVIRSDLSKLDGKIVGISTVSVTSQGYQYNSASSWVSPSDIPVEHPVVLCSDGKELPCPNPDKYHYLGTVQHLTLSEKFKDINIPFGDVAFSASKDKPWDLDVKSRTYKLNTVIITTQDSRQILYHKMKIDVDGKSYEVPGLQATYTQQYPTASFSWWNPKLYMGLNSGYSFSQEFNNSVGLHFSVMSYGKEYLSPDYNFFVLGVGVDLNKHFVQDQVHF